MTNADASKANYTHTRMHTHIFIYMHVFFVIVLVDEGFFYVY